MLVGNIFNDIKNIGAGYGTINTSTTIEYSDTIDTLPFNSVTITWILRSLTGDAGTVRFFLEHSSGPDWPGEFSPVEQYDVIGPVDTDGLRNPLQDGEYKTIDVSDYAENVTISVCYVGQKRYIKSYLTSESVSGVYYYSVFATLGGISNGKATSRYILDASI